MGTNKFSSEKYPQTTAAIHVITNTPIKIGVNLEDSCFSLIFDKRLLATKITTAIEIIPYQNVGPFKFICLRAV